MSNIIDSRPYIFFAYSVIGFAVFNIKKFGQNLFSFCLFPYLSFLLFRVDFESNTCSEPIHSKTLQIIFLLRVPIFSFIIYTRENHCTVWKEFTTSFFTNSVFQSSKNPSFSHYLNWFWPANLSINFSNSYSRYFLIIEWIII